MVETDYLVIGSGLAGLVAALKLAEHGQVVLATKKAAAVSNSSWAQGGIACVVDSDDRLEDHVQDTLIAGAGLCRRETVEAIITAGREEIRFLESLGLQFERRLGHPDEYDLGMEGGHSRRRVLRIGDITGAETTRVLIGQVEAHPRIRLCPGWMAVDLITTSWLGVGGENRVVGAYVLDRETGAIEAVRARATVLATGGAGKTYLYTTNPDTATGDGIAMAWRAGVPILNLEFVQFHPTCFYHPKAKSFLVSEAVRGEGAELRNAKGEAFMTRHDPRGALAPRDIVARAIDLEMKTTGAACVYLDITHQSRDFLIHRFPNIHAFLMEHGVDMATDPIPVVPAAHYCCGGVEAEVDGRTSLPGLYVCGETACTGMHGANRLASNSLLEALVMAAGAARAMVAEPPPPGPPVVIPEWVYGRAVPSDERVVVEHNWDEVRRAMWDYVGIVRSSKRLLRAWRRIRNLRSEIREYYLDYVPTPDTLELRNLADVAELIVRCAISRQESRGLHYTLDFPDADTLRPPRDTRIIDPPGGAIV